MKKTFNGLLAGLAVTSIASASTGWVTNGQGVVYYQTNAEDAFTQDASVANVGVQLSAQNQNIFNGFGAGIELTGLGTFGLEDRVISGTMQSADGTNNGGAVTQVYLTFSHGNTQGKIGTFNIDQKISPFAFSEDWNVFKNSFAAVTVTNTSIPDTTIVGAYIDQANSHKNLQAFDDLMGGMYMLTVLNQYITGLDLTGTVYHAPDMLGSTNIGWVSGDFSAYNIDFGIQGGVVSNDKDETYAYGVKMGYDFGLFDLTAKYSNVSDGVVSVKNLAGDFSPMYTQLLMNGDYIARNNQTYAGTVGVDVLGGNVSTSYAFTESDKHDFQEADVIYTTEFNGLSVLAGYIFTHGIVEDHTLRGWVRYNF